MDHITVNVSPLVCSGRKRRSKRERETLRKAANQSVVISSVLSISRNRCPQIQSLCQPQQAGPICPVQSHGLACSKSEVFSVWTRLCQCSRQQCSLHPSLRIGLSSGLGDETTATVTLPEPFHWLAQWSQFWGRHHLLWGRHHLPLPPAASTAPAASPFCGTGRQVPAGAAAQQAGGEPWQAP